MKRELISKSFTLAMLLMTASSSMAQKYHAAALQGFYGKIQQIKVYGNDTLTATYSYSKDGRLLNDKGEIDPTIQYGKNGYPVSMRVERENSPVTYTYEWEKKNKVMRLKKSVSDDKVPVRTEYIYDKGAENVGMNVKQKSKTFVGDATRDIDAETASFDYNFPDKSGNIIRRRKRVNTTYTQKDYVERIEITYFKEGRLANATQYIYSLPKGEPREEQSRFRDANYTNAYLPHERKGIVNAPVASSITAAEIATRGKDVPTDRFPFMDGSQFRTKWNTPSWRKRSLGVSAGYVHKRWQRKGTNVKENSGFLRDEAGAPVHDYVQGVQAGIRLEPQFTYGIGLNTGLFYEYFFEKGTIVNDSYKTANEFGIHIPLHLEYRGNIYEYLQVFAFGGVSFDYILSGSLKPHGPEVDKYTKNDDIDYSAENDLKRYNASIEFGVGIRVKGFQFQWETSSGFLNMSGNADYTVKQSRPMTLSVSWMF